MILLLVLITAFIAFLVGVAIVVIAAYVAVIRAVILWLRDRLIG